MTAQWMGVWARSQSAKSITSKYTALFANVSNEKLYLSVRGSQSKKLLFVLVERCSSPKSGKRYNKRYHQSKNMHAAMKKVFFSGQCSA